MGYHVPPERMALLRGRAIALDDNPFFAEAARTRRPVYASDVRADARFVWHDERTVPRALLFVPIVANDRMLGGFAAVWWTEARELAPGEIRLAEAVASQAGVALENARLFLDHQRRVEELSVLYELSRAVTGRLDRTELLEVFQAQVARVLDGRNLVVLLLDAERDDIEVALRIQDGQRDMRMPLRYERGFGLMSVVLATGKPVRTADYAAECQARGVVAVPAIVPYPYWLGAPLAAGEELLGMVAVGNAERAFTERDERLLASVADLMALALRSSHLYEERTRALGELAAAQDQLVRTEKLRALGEMASGVAHDFNNLLAAILGRAQLLLEEVSHPTHRRWLEVIERSAMDGAETVRRLQGFTRIRRDQPFVAVDLNRIVREALEVTEARWREEPRSRGVSIEVGTALTPALPRVAGDPVELREVLTNLVLNAVDAMAQGGTLTLATARVGDRVEVTVADTGVGMPAEVRERIFDPFFTTKGPQGTGLGLSITYGILSRHGAQVAVDSEPGQGTTFRLSFPRSELADAPSDAPATVEAGPLRCLVVDDEPAVGEVLGDILLSMGHAATVLEDSRQAARAFEAEGSDAVFTDLAMPGLSGWEVARAIKDRRPDVPVFMVTGFGVEVSPQELEANGVDRVLPKPLKIQDVRSLLATVRRHDG
jgi:signal transduction histidine kinase/CheY-like chemotaxis protein